MLRRHPPVIGLLPSSGSSVTNTATDGSNGLVQTLTYSAHGFKSFKNYRDRILFFCCSLDQKVVAPLPLQRQKKP
jgi:hypothetical protein